MLDLSQGNLADIRKLISATLPEREFRVFGSRVRGTAKRYSDVDLLIMGKSPCPQQALELLRDRLSESDIPVMVDVVEYCRLDDKMKALFLDGSIRIWPEYTEDVPSGG